jgi:two-component system CheB/CheR fusion protein
MSANDPGDSPQVPSTLAPEKVSHLPFPIVGVGASAGGLEAFTDLLENLPPKPGMAFMFTLHLEPHHKSMLPQILARSTKMSVQEATQDMPVEVDHVYLVPPSTNFALEDGKLGLAARSTGRGPNMPADYLFRSLATTQKDKAIAVILSGGGTDGTLGFQAIKAEGGITFVQDERSARQGGMPRSAIADGNVDYVLAPREIARQLMELNQHPYTREETRDSFPGAAGAVSDILSLLRTHTAVDFTHYKPSTIKRRVQRRMALRGLVDAGNYLRLLHEDPAEMQALYQDFLIRVTQFFRDPEAFEALQREGYPRLIETHSASTPVRIWVAGCATGEEVYSLAISLLECMSDGAGAIPIKILATDLSEGALDRARSGVYPDNIEIDVSSERLRRFFVRVDGHYQISKSVRDLCVFSRHNLVADPPFSRLDLVSCRNVLIYMDTALQKRVLPILHYALNKDGILFLGSSENIGTFGDLFDTVDPRWRIFTKKPSPGVMPVEFGNLPGGRLMDIFPREQSRVQWTALDVQKEADRVVLARYAPVGVVIDENGVVLQFRGRTAPFLEPASGMASLDLNRMLREGLLAEVRQAINRARAENSVVRRSNLRIFEAEQTRLVEIEVIPLKIPPSGVRFFLVMFRDMETPLAAAAPPSSEEVRTPINETQVVQLQEELTSLREYLQSVIEEQESTNEELKSANEEILSANEELQSTNEELQTAKEEAQSANEELATVNEELQHRNSDLTRVNNDLVNLLSGVNIPIVMVSRDLRLRRFTPQAEKLLNLIPTDVGRPISDINPNLNLPNVVRLIQQVIDTLTPHECEVQDKDGHWYSLRIRPYITLDNKIDGASLVLLDIDSLRQEKG